MKQILKFNKIFTDNILTLEEIESDQKVTAFIKDLDGEIVFDLFNTNNLAAEAKPVSSKGVKVFSNHTSVTVKFTSEQLKKLDNSVCRIDVFYIPKNEKVNEFIRLTHTFTKQTTDDIKEPFIADGSTKLLPPISSYSEKSILIYPTRATMLTVPKQQILLKEDDPNLHSYFILFYTDPSNKEGSVIEGSKRHVKRQNGKLPLIVNIDDIPLTGKPVYFEFSYLFDDGTGKVNWNSDYLYQEVYKLETIDAQSETRTNPTVPVVEVIAELSGVHNNYGHKADSSHFKIPANVNSKGQLVLKDIHNKTFENIKIEIKGDLPVPWHNFTSGIELINCSNLVFNNGYIKMGKNSRTNPTRKPDKGWNRYSCGFGIKESHNITINRFNIDFGKNSIRTWRSTGIKVNDTLLKDATSSYILLTEMPGTDDHRFTIENCYCYRSADVFHPYYTVSSLDPTNFSGISKRGSAPHPLMMDVHIEGGQGLYGSGVGIVDGTDYEGESGGIHMYRLSALDTGNKFTAMAAGNGSRYYDCWGYQDDPLHANVREGLIKGTGLDPVKHAHRFKYGMTAGYHADYYRQGIKNQQDTNFGKGFFKGLRVHYVKDGVVVPWTRELFSGSPVSKWRFPTPKGNEATYIDCLVDADKVDGVIHKRDVRGQKNWKTPCITRKEITERARKVHRNIPMWSGFGAGSMYFARLNGDI